jgi:hypothetical protein
MELKLRLDYYECIAMEIATVLMFETNRWIFERNKRRAEPCLADPNKLLLACLEPPLVGVFVLEGRRGPPTAIGAGRAYAMMVSTATK